MDTGSLLRLMHGAVDGWETFQAECREWRHTRRGFEAVVRMFEGRGEMQRLGSPSEAAEPEVVEEVVRLWVAARMRRIRQETVLSDGRTGAVVVVDGERWWLFNPSQGVLRHDGGESHSVGTFDVASILDPAEVIPHLDFGEIRAGDVDGRACWVVDATPREAQHERRPGSRLPGGADRYRLWIDQERGVALRVEASWRAEPFSIREATGVVFDAPLPDELFAFRPPAGAPVFSTRDEPDVREVSIEEAARLAPFTVLAPSRLPGAMTLQVVRYASGGGFSGMRPSAMLLARDMSGSAGYVAIDQTAVVDAHDDGLDWQATTHGGATYLTYDDGRKRSVKLDTHGTRAVLSGPLELAALLDIAESLEPATTATDSDHPE